jgi:AcrR family transcriptional regulator
MPTGGLVAPTADETAELGLRERKKRQTRQAIRDAAVRLVADRGLERVTVDEIAAAANVSPRTFFNYFRSKEDALGGIDNEEVDEVCALLRARPAAEPPLVAIGNMFVERYERRNLDPSLYLARAQLHQANPQLFGAQAATLRNYERRLAEVIGERAGLGVDEHPYPMTVVLTAMSLIRATVSYWQRSGQTVSTALLVGALRAGFANLAQGLPVPTTQAP